MIINSANLASVRTGFSTAFKKGLGQTSSLYTKIATIVPSTTKDQKYGWLGKIPNVREWIGPRAVQNLSEHSYEISEKKWELTIGVDRDDIETDNIGVYAPLFEEMGMSTGAKWDELVWGLLAAGFTTECYDGQNYFDTDHPVLDKDGNPTSVANTDGGSGTPWFLVDASRALKPIILQKRKDFQFVAKDNPTDDNVFDNNEFKYGADARANVGFGFWQFAWGSKQTLDAAHYSAARAGLMGMKGDYGRPLGLLAGAQKPMLIVPPSLESAGRKLLNNELGSGGETNEWKGTVELLVVPWLA
ncbi:Mu-like prophage major head subunit gpT family protein [Citromicrobium bathyomarinum]